MDAVTGTAQATREERANHAREVYQHNLDRAGNQGIMGGGILTAIDAWEREPELLALVAELFMMAEEGYGWVCNFPESSLSNPQVKFAVGKRIAEFLYTDPRLASVRENIRQRQKPANIE